MSVVVRGGTVVTPGRVRRADILIGDDGRIAAVGLDAPDGQTTIDAGGLHVFPGMVDGHVHFQEPGREAWEGFDTGSAAAAAGGVTTVVDMPIDSDPPTITADAVRTKAGCVPRHSRVDVAMWGGLVPSSVSQVDAMVHEGVCGLKAFACSSGWDDFPAADEATLAAGCRAAARAGIPVAVHCELEELGHTVESEVEAVRRAGRIARQEMANLHVVHVSAWEAVAEARWWGATVETCPHYLVLTDADAAAIGPDAHANPPIRDAANRERLWTALANRHITMVTSDHSPCPAEYKATGWAGIDGVGMTLPLLLDARRLDLCDIARVTTEAARLLRLPGKGAIEVGADGDLALVDLRAAATLQARSRNKRSPFEGRPVQGRVEMTLVRGRVVFAQNFGHNFGPSLGRYFPESGPGGGRVVRPVR